MNILEKARAELRGRMFEFAGQVWTTLHAIDDSGFVLAVPTMADMSSPIVVSLVRLPEFDEFQADSKAANASSRLASSRFFHGYSGRRVNIAFGRFSVEALSARCCESDCQLLLCPLS